MGIVLRGIITQLPTRYHQTSQQFLSAANERVGLEGWIVDRICGKESDLEEDSAKLAIADLIERKLAQTTSTRRLEATPEGACLWHQLESKGS